MSLYLTTPESFATMKPRVEKIRSLLADNAEELEHFEENLKLVDAWLAEHRWETEGVSSWTRSRRCPRPARWRRC